MCHNSVLAWAGSLPADLFDGKDVLEVGSYDENGTVRPLIEAHGPASYTGVDMRQGPGVDLVADVSTLPKKFPHGFDVVITTETLEHVEDWRKAVTALAELVKPGGHLILSTRSPGFPYHPYPVDLWRYPPELMRQILTALGFEAECIPDPEAPGVFAVATMKRHVRKSKHKDPLVGIEVPGV